MTQVAATWAAVWGGRPRPQPAPGPASRRADEGVRRGPGGPPHKAAATTITPSNVIRGLFLFGTARVGDFLEKGFSFISMGNDRHHVLTPAGACVKELESIAPSKSRPWKRLDGAVVAGRPALLSGCQAPQREEGKLACERKVR